MITERIGSTMDCSTCGTVLIMSQLGWWDVLEEKLHVCPSTENQSATGAGFTPNGARLAREFDFTEAGQADLFADANDGKIRFSHALGAWLIFEAERHRWVLDRDGEITRRIIMAARLRLMLAASIEDFDKRKAATRFAESMESARAVAAVEKLARAHHLLADTGEGWDADSFLLGVHNGVVDLRAMELRPGKPEDRITLQAGCAFDPDAECPRWLRFLEEVLVDPEVIAFVQRWIGLCVTGDMSAQAFVLMHGSGANGKSVLLNTLRRLLGDYAVNLPFSTFELKDRSQLSPDLALLPGKRLVLSSETNDATRVNEARIKALTGGDPLTARPLYGKPFTFQPSAKLMFGTNVLPSVRDDSDAFWRRAHVIRFDRQFKGADVDARLEEKLAAELPGILRWALEGARQFLEGGLRPPDAVLLGALRWREESDPLANFVNERCVVMEGAMVRAAPFFTAYDAWVRDAGIPESERLKSIAFGKAMKLRYEQGRDTAGIFYRGVGLRTDYPDGHAMQGSDSPPTSTAPLTPTQPYMERDAMQGSSNLSAGYVAESRKFSHANPHVETNSETLHNPTSLHEPQPLPASEERALNHCQDCGEPCGTALRCAPCAMKRVTR